MNAIGEKGECGAVTGAGKGQDTTVRDRLDFGGAACWFRGMPILAHRDFGGEGRPELVILHGLLGSSRNWQSAGRDLTAHFHVCALDLRNHGASFHAREMTYGTLAGDVAAWMDAHDIGQAHVLGHSLGGKVAMRLACEEPQRINRLVVVDIAPRSYRGTHNPEFSAMLGLDLAAIQSRQDAEKALEQQVPDWAFRKFLLTNLERTSNERFRWTINLPDLAAAIPALEDEPLAPEHHFDGETLFVLGGKSRYFKAEDETRVKQYFPAARIETVAESGHNPHFDTREQFASLVRDFLQ